MMNPSPEAIEARSNFDDWFPGRFPESATIQKNGRYLIVMNAAGLRVAGYRGRVPFHRLVLWEKLFRPHYTECHWCKHMLPWNVGLMNAVSHVVNADHLDANTSNNNPSNLVASCAWCNANRGWAENYPGFWSSWRRWMSQVPPGMRPNLIQIAKDHGIIVDLTKEEAA